MAEQFAILIVDDNGNNRFSLRALLGQQPGCQIEEADSGEAALLRTVEQQFDLILLDVQMPGMDGFETARHLQMTERTRHIPVVFLTAVFKAEEFMARGYELGAVDYLTKPIDDHQMLNRVRLYQHLHDREFRLAQALRLAEQREQAMLLAKEAAEATALELRKLSLAVEHSPYSLFITDTAGVIEYVNPMSTTPGIPPPRQSDKRPACSSPARQPTRSTSNSGKPSCPAGSGAVIWSTDTRTGSSTGCRHRSPRSMTTPARCRTSSACTSTSPKR
jgi:CheY-like chemotaxis protein